MFPTGCHVPYTYAIFYRLFPEEWPANLLPASGSYCGSCRSGVALHLQERFTGPVLKRKPCQPSQVNINIFIIFIDILIIYLYNIFSVNYYHLRVFFFFHLKGLAVLELLLQVSSQIPMLGIQQYRLLLLG